MANGPNGGAEFKTPGGWALKVGGPLALVVAMFGLMMWLGWQDRQAWLADRSAIVKDINLRFEALIREQKMLRCAMMIPPADRPTVRDYLTTDDMWRRHCRWLDYTEGGGVPSKGVYP